MQLTGITQFLRDQSVYRDGLARLNADHDLMLPVIRSARPLLTAALARDWPGPIIYVTAQIRRAYNVAEQLPVWLEAGEDAASALHFTEPGAKFYERVLWGEATIRNRLETLAALMASDEHAGSSPIIVTSARALMQRTLPVNVFRRVMMTLEPGQRHAMDDLLAKWVGLGYEAVPVVLEPGTFSRRGGVLDIFPVASRRPIRIDFFDDEIESLRAFDPATQRSADVLDSVIITPAREALPESAPVVAQRLHDWFAGLPSATDDMTSFAADADSLANGAAFPHLEHYLPLMYPHPVSLLDYAPPETLIVVEDGEMLTDAFAEIEADAERTREESLAAGLLSEDHPAPYVTSALLAESLKEANTLHLASTVPEDDTGFAKLFVSGGRFGGQLRPTLTHLRDLHAKGDGVVVVTEQVGRLTQLWYEQDASTYLPIQNDVETLPGRESLSFVNGTLGEGWSLKGRETTLHLFTDAEIFGWSRPEPRRRKIARPARAPETDYADWKEGDYVVHVDYGIGQFSGMRHRTVEGVEREYLVVNYGGSDMLFVPIHQADRLTRYVGADGSPPTLNKLGQQEWARVSRKARKAVEEEATELLALYAARAQASGHVYQADSGWQHELEASFPFVETEDQLRAVHEVKADMHAPNPMDRLICGDVGYGKTEVALRAAFKAVMDGKQVAVLVPTTVLAQQHYETFSSRLAPFPVQVEMMSRFRTREHQNRLLPQIASGEIDIVIGTHRLLSADVTFKDLSLVIIDEEQRFGVKHKEHFKKLRSRVDVLTLTATPIPRTLYMSLTGVRDISMIQTPPEERLPVITHVGGFDEKLIRAAILRELERGGQAFVVHNRVRTIESLLARLESIVPEARIVIGHGQMHERTLEKVMAAFARGEYDILLATSIIENGIDIPNANTLIVDRADWFGVSQLYQLRGRVGRAAQQAYAYFFHGRGLTGEARERLDTLAENTSLGAGFQIAMRDLEMRGAGDILSHRQTGHVAAIGLHLYTQLLTGAIQKLKGEPDSGPRPAASRSGIVIDLPVAAYLPENWIPEMALRLQIYRRIAALTTQADIDAFRAELGDRFGTLPVAVDGLLFQIEVKLLAQAANATHVMARDNKVQIKLPYLGEINRAALEQSLGEDVSVTRTAISFPLVDETWQIRLLDMLAQLRQNEETGEGVGI